MNNQDAIKLELAGLRYLYKRLQPLLKNLQSGVAQEDQKRKEHFESLCEYKTVEDAQEAYGYQEITNDELYEIMDMLEFGEDEMQKVVTKRTVALCILQDFLRQLEKNALEFEYEQLTDAEKAARAERQKQWEQRVAKLRENRRMQR